jgi:hypothetical protein
VAAVEIVILVVLEAVVVLVVLELAPALLLLREPHIA